MPYRSLIGLLAFSLCAEEPVILRPNNGAFLKPGEITVISRGAGLSLDGKAVAEVKRAPGVWTAAINPAPGEHQLKASTGPAIRFRVSPDGTYRAHPPAAACETCHAVRNGAWELRTAALESACSTCHNLKNFAVGHSHNTATLADCQNCHDPHGSQAKFLLKMPKQTACKQCHG